MGSLIVRQSKHSTTCSIDASCVTPDDLKQHYNCVQIQEKTVNIDCYGEVRLEYILIFECSCNVPCYNVQSIISFVTHIIVIDWILHWECCIILYTTFETSVITRVQRLWKHNVGTPLVFPCKERGSVSVHGEVWTYNMY